MSLGMRNTTLAVIFLDTMIEIARQENLGGKMQYNVVQVMAFLANGMPWRTSCNGLSMSASHFSVLSVPKQTSSPCQLPASRSSCEKGYRDCGHLRSPKRLRTPTRFWTFRSKAVSNDDLFETLALPMGPPDPPDGAP